MRVPFVDLGAQYERIGDALEDAMRGVIRDKSFILGPHVAAFETAFARYCGAKHCIGVASGTDALFLALRSLGVGPGHEVLVPAVSFIATAEAVSMTGAEPVFTEVDPVTGCMDPEDAASRITSRTRAIIPVHLYGRPADMDALGRLAERHGLFMVQDCAQAHGAMLRGKPLNDSGGVLCFSFYPGKNLGAFGDAGAVVTDDEALARRVRMLANHGRSDKYDHEFEGVNSRMDGLQGAILGVKLEYLETWTEERRKTAARYDSSLAGLDGVAPLPPADNARHVYHLYVVRASDRDGLRDFLRERDVAAGVHYPKALPFLKAYSRLGHTPDDFPNAYAMTSEVLSLPMYPELTGEAVAHVAGTVRLFASNQTG